MNHLTDEQLAAQLDGVRSDSADAHLAGCEACRARLADMASLDESLGRVLTHDPGEAYFASFAGRVAERIAREARPEAAAAPAKSGWFAWWNSPRSLAWAGGALALIAVAALAIVVGRDRSVRPAAERAPASEVGRAATPPAANELDSRREATPGAGQAGAPAARGAGALAGGAAPAEQKATSRAGSPEAAKFRAQVEGEPMPAPAPQVMSRGGANAPMRLQQLKTLPGGEQIPVSDGTLPPGARPAGVRTPSGFMKPGATPMSAQAAPREDRGARKAMPAPAPAANSEERGFASAAPPAAAAAPGTMRALALPPAATQSEIADRVSISPGHRPPVTLSEDAVAPASVHLCGVVHDTRNRLLAGVVLSVAETGASTTSADDGTFCIDAPNAHPTIEAFSVGYLTFRGEATSGASQALAVTLVPVDALAHPLALGKAASGERLGFRGGPTPDGPASLLATQSARLATSAARRTRTAAAWQKAADEWVKAAASLAAVPAGQLDARFHVAEAGVNAWRIGHTAAERAAANAAVSDYLAAAPAGPLRDLAEGWRKELAP